MFTQVIISLAIAILHSLFFSKLSHLIVKDETVKEIYKVKKYVQKSTGQKYSYVPQVKPDGTLYDANDFEITRDYEENIKKIKAQNTKHFCVLLVTSIIGIIGSTMISNITVSMGISGGSILLILYKTYLYWFVMDEYIKLGLIAASIGILTYTSYNFVPSFI